MSNNHSVDSNREGLPRRRFVRGLGAAGVTVGLAGCGGQEAVETDTPGSGNGDGNGDGNGNGDDVQPAVEFDSEAMGTIQELAYVTNQALPVLPVMEKLAQSFQATGDWDVPPRDSEKLQVYWPTEWLPREGDWTASGDDDRLTLAQWAVPSDSQYNPWNDKNYAEPRRMLFDRFMKYNLATQEYTGYAISDWEIDGTSITLVVRDGLTWHDGDDVTATDVANQVKLDIYTGGDLGRFVAPDDEGTVSDRVQAVDDSTVEIELATSVNEQVLLAHLQPTRLVAHDGTYGDDVAALDDASGDDERSELLGDLFGRSIDDPVGCGPFEFADADSQRTLLSKFDDHPDAGEINVSEAEFLYKPENQARWDGLINGETDGSATLFMPKNKLDQLPDSVQVSLIPRHWGMGLIFNHDRAPVDDVRVRQAIAHVVDREAAAANSGAGTDSKIAVTYPSGLTGEFNGQVESHWLDGVADEFETYGPGESRTDRAAELLEDAGYERQDGTWQKEGQALEIPIKGTAAFSDWVAGVETIVAQLQEFGIEAESLMRDNSTYWGQDYVNGDFVVALNGWASYDHAHPYFHFNWLYNSGDATDFWSLPDEFDVDVLHDEIRDGATVDPSALVSELSTADE